MSEFLYECPFEFVLLVWYNWLLVVYTSAYANLVLFTNYNHSMPVMMNIGIIIDIMVAFWHTAVCTSAVVCATVAVVPIRFTFLYTQTQRVTICFDLFLMYL